MGSPVSVPIAELVMQSIESSILDKFKSGIAFWVRYVDDVFAIIEPSLLNDIFKFANNINPDIQFTVELESNSLSLPFLDVLILRQNNSPCQSFDFSVYRKPTHSGQYLNFNSCNPISHKRSVLKSLCNRAKIYCSTDNSLKTELKFITRDLLLNDYPYNFIRNFVFSFFKSDAQVNLQASPANTNTRMTLPYAQGFSEAIKFFFRRHKIQIAFIPANKIKSLIGAPYPPTLPLDKLNIVYSIPCEGCVQYYFGETGRSFRIREKEHKLKFKNQDSSSKIVQHAIETDHRPNWSNANIIQLKNNNIRFRKFMEGWHSKIYSKVLNEFTSPPSDFAVLLPRTDPFRHQRNLQNSS